MDGMKFLFHGVSGLTSNYGVEAIARGTVRMLSEHFPGSTCTFVSFRSADLEEERLGPESGIRVVNSSSGLPLLVRRVRRKLDSHMGKWRLEVPYGHLASADCVLCIGGDLYTFAEREMNWPYPWAVVDSGNAIMDRGVPYVIWCASIGPFDKAGARIDELVDHLRRCAAVIVREPESYRYLRDELSLADNVFLAADPAFLMDPREFPAPFLKPTGEPLLGVNLSPGCIEHVFGAENVSEVLETYVRALETVLRSRDLRLLLVPHVERDYAFLSLVHDRLCSVAGERTWMLPERLGSPRTKWAVSRCDGLLTMRFHCALAGFGTGTPTALLLSSEKGRKLALDMYAGRTEWLIDMRGLAQDRLVGAVERLLANRREIAAELADALPAMKERSMKAGACLRDALDGGSGADAVR